MCRSILTRRVRRTVCRRQHYTQRDGRFQVHRRPYRVSIQLTRVCDTSALQRSPAPVRAPGRRAPSDIRAGSRVGGSARADGP